MINNILLRCAVTLAAISAAILHVTCPEIVPDAITSGFLILAILPWLAPLIKSVELPGIGKIELTDLVQKTEEARGAAASAERKVELALADKGLPSSEVAPPAAHSYGQLAALAEEYNQIRSSQVPGPTRTSAMASVVSRMMRASAFLSIDDINKSLLNRNDGGVRLIGYAALYVRPVFSLLESLVVSVTALEDKPFGQYWGILAIGSVVGNRQTNEEVDPAIIKSLSGYFSSLQPGTDRYYELDRILSELNGGHRRKRRDGFHGRNIN